MLERARIRAWNARGLLAFLGAAQLVAPISAGEDWQPISYLPLAGSSYDAVTCGHSVFSRDSVAFDRSGSEKAVDQTRTACFAAEARRTFNFIETGLPNLHLRTSDCSLFYGTISEELYSSSDGTTWSLVATLPEYIRSVFITRSGAILVALAPDGAGRLFRRGPGEQDFVQVLDFDEGLPATRNYTETDTYILASEYGTGNNKHQPNPRRIYRSADDGVTWQLIYDPEFRDTHNHVLGWDSYTGRLMQATGDGPGNSGFVTSDDNGESWQVKRHEIYMPISVLARPEAVYWGLDGPDPAGVARQVRGSNNWDLVLYVGRDYPYPEDQFDGNVPAVVELGGLMLAPFDRTAKGSKHAASAMYASADGEHWTLSGRFGFEWGLSECLGICGETLWLRYVQAQAVSEGNLLLQVGLPQCHRLIRGTRLEGAVTNLWDNAATSSAEDALDGWSTFGGASVQPDTEVVWHGQQSAHLTCATATYAGVTLPIYEGSLQAATTVSVSAQLYGSPRVLKLQVYDGAGSNVATTMFTHLSHRWRPAVCTFLLPADTDSLSVKLLTRNATPGVDFRVDGIMLTAGRGGDTWQIGGQPRSADVCRYEFAFPQVWTDVFLWAPDPGTDGPRATARTLKVYEASDGRQLSIVYDPVGNLLRLDDSGDATSTVITPPFVLAPHAVVQVAVVQSPTMRTLYVRIAEDPYVSSATGAPLQIVRTYLGSDGSAQNAAGGLLARNQLFDQEADVTRIGQIFEALICAPTPGDLDEDTDVDLNDLTVFQGCLSGPGVALRPDCDAVDFDRDSDVDLLDFRSFSLAFTGAL